jgi:hypothetical protein
LGARVTTKRPRSHRADAIQQRCNKQTDLIGSDRCPFWHSVLLKLVFVNILSGHARADPLIVVTVRTPSSRKCPQIGDSSGFHG